MAFEIDHLKGLSDFVHAFSFELLKRKDLSQSLEIDSIILYGSGAKHQLGKVEKYNDYDLNVFLKRLPKYKKGDARKLNRRGGYWNAGSFKGQNPVALKVEVLFNIISLNQPWVEYCNNARAKRWNSICENPVVLLFPNYYCYNKLNP